MADGIEHRVGKLETDMTEVKVAQGRTEEKVEGLSNIQADFKGQVDAVRTTMRNGLFWLVGVVITAAIANGVLAKW